MPGGSGCRLKPLTRTGETKTVVLPVALSKTSSEVKRDQRSDYLLIRKSASCRRLLICLIISGLRAQSIDFSSG